jgi:DNA-binding NarL/FixJ family response regulator
MQADVSILEQQHTRDTDSNLIARHVTIPAPTGHGVLIVDDSKLLQLRLTAMVESLGYGVVGVADDGSSGVKMAVALNPRLIILDHQMPVMNGLECLREIRQRRYEINAIVCSATITEHLTLEYSQLGIAGIFAKPVQYNLLTCAVNEAMQGAPVERP